MFDNPFNEQSKLVGPIAERIMMASGVSIAMSDDVAETTLVPRSPTRSASDVELLVNAIMVRVRSKAELGRSVVRRDHHGPLCEDEDNERITPRSRRPDDVPTPATGCGPNVGGSFSQADYHHPAAELGAVVSVGLVFYNLAILPGDTRDVIAY